MGKSVHIRADVHRDQKPASDSPGSEVRSPTSVLGTRFGSSVSAEHTFNSLTLNQEYFKPKIPS